MFLEVPAEQRLAENDLAFAIFDANPASPGHCLIVPKRLIASWFRATESEALAAMGLVTSVKRLLDEQFAPDGYNVGFNDGVAGGQTVFHAHLHMIPRYAGDVQDPTGGVRHAVVGRGHYSPKRVSD